MASRGQRLNNLLAKTNGGYLVPKAGCYKPLTKAPWRRFRPAANLARLGCLMLKNRMHGAPSPGDFGIAPMNLGAPGPIFGPGKAQIHGIRASGGRHGFRLPPHQHAQYLAVGFVHGQTERARRSSTLPCSMNWSGQPMRTTGTGLPISCSASVTADPNPPIFT